MKTTLLALAVCCAATGTFAEKPDRVLPYKETPQGELKLHIFNPPNHSSKDRKPAIVFFFGGGWYGGSPGHFYRQSEHSASHGMVAICPEYRTKKIHGTDPRASVMDAKSAMRWVRTHADELGIDPERILAGGGSAGGHLAAATATVTQFNEPDEEPSIDCRPKALVLYNPVFDNGSEGYGYDRVKEYWQDFSPMHNLKPGTPPTLIFLGTQDKYIPVATAEKYRNLMKANGDRCDLHLYQDRPHGFYNRSNDKHGDFDDTLKKMDAFLASLGYFAPDNPDETLDAAKLPLVSARMVEKELLIIYNLPEGQHATVSESFNFMTVETSAIQGLEFGKTIYPEGKKDAEGNTEYHGIVILRKPIKILSGYDFEPQTVAVTAGYQLCLDSGVCMPPKKKTIRLTVALQKQ